MREILKHEIIKLVRQRPMTSTQIAEQLDAKRNSVKTALFKLIREDQVVRAKILRDNVDTIKGPKNVYIYTAQRGEEVSRIAHNDEVTGSIPVAATTTQGEHHA